MARGRRHALLLMLSLLSVASGGCETAPPAPRLVVLYAPCTVNRDFLSPYRPAVRFTPQLATFAQDAQVFLNNVAEAGQSGIAYASLFSGVHANVHGAYRHPARLPEHVYQISEAYRDAGYDTYFWSGHPMASHELRYGQGVSDDHAYVFTSDRLSDYTATNEQFARILGRLRSDPSYRVFVQINFTITHDPYHRYANRKVQRRFLRAFPEERPPVDTATFNRLLRLYAAHSYQLMRNFPEASERLGLSGSDVRELAQVLEFVYKAAIFQLDEYFGRLLDSIREAGLYDESLIAFTTDHGEIGFRENALYKWTHGLQLAPEVLYVPLIIRGPAVGLPSGRHAGVTRSIDVYPTLAALSGVAIPDDVRMAGIDLSPVIRAGTPPADLIAFSHTSTLGGGVLGYYRKAGLKLALTRIPRDDVELIWVGARRGNLAYKSIFDGESWSHVVFDHVLDPGEKNDLFEIADPDQREMFERLRTYKRLLVTAASGEPQRLSPAELESLRALGYIGP